MSYKTPVFPATCSVWSGSKVLYNADKWTTTGPPRLSAQICEVVGRGGQGMTINPYTLNQTMSVYYYAQMVLIYFPKGTDIRGAENTLTLSDTIKTSDGWIFWCQNVFPIAHGFDNEFLAAACAVAIAP